MSAPARRRGRWLAGLVAATALVACSADQEPGLDPSDGSTSSITTSRVLAPCPPGGPDGTTPPAGCLAEDGTVQRP